MFGFGPQELIIILIILVVLFGGTQIPKIARALGASLGEFRRGVKGSRIESSKGEEARDASTL